MDYPEKEALVKCQVFLVEELVLTDLYDHLLEEGIFTRPMLDNIQPLRCVQAVGGKREQVKRLLSDLPRRGPTAFNKFLVCLYQTGQAHIADHIQQKLLVLGGQPQQVSPANLPITAIQTEKFSKGDRYSIDRGNHGAVLIINNHFNSMPLAKGPVFYGRLPKRTGTDQDQHSLIALFTEHLQGFWPLIVPDVPGSRLLSVVREFFNSKQCSSLILALMTHGDDGGVLYGDDGEPVNIKDIIDVLQELPWYNGRPKMLVIQACRGGAKDTGVLATDGAYEAATDAIPAESELTPEAEEQLLASLTSLSLEATEQIKHCSSMLDTFIFYSTVSGYASLRSRQHGSWFIQDFCSTLQAQAATYDVRDLATMINNSVSRRFSTELGVQVSQHVSTLTKKWFLLHSG